jgi:hypothetical protein
VVLSIGVAVLAAALAVTAAVSLLIGQPMLGSGTLWYTLFFVVFALFAVRNTQVGVYIGDRGVRTRWPVLTRTIEWSDIVGFEARPAKGWYAGSPRPEAIWIVAKGREPIQTPLRSRSRAVHNPPRSPHGDSLALSQEEFDAALQLLRDRLK